MSRRNVISLSITFFFCCNSIGQAFYHWNKDSISASLQKVFPNAISIQLTNSIGEEHSDSLISRWSAKAAILEGDSGRIFFYFFTISDTSIIRTMVVASLNSMVAAARDSANHNYVFSFPFVDSFGTKAIMYYATLNRDSGYYGALEERICKSFRVPHYQESFRTKVHIEAITPDSTMTPPPPPQPPPPSPKKKKQKH